MNRIKQLPQWLIYGLLAYMPLHVFLSQSLSLVTGGLSVWKLWKDVVICLAALILVLFMRKKIIENSHLRLILVLTAIYAILHAMLYLILKDTTIDVAALASVYNLRPFLLLLIGVEAVLIAPQLTSSKVFKFALIVSTVIAAIGIVQYFLPADFLSHFGYSESRGAKPNFLIDNKADLFRIMSTLREPNSFGAFLVLPLLVLTRQLLKDRNKLLFGGLFLLHALALILTFSRSAWLTFFISELALVVFLYKERLIPYLKKFWLVGALVLVVMMGGIFVLRDQYFVQNVVFHGDENTVGADSSKKHLSSIETGTDAIIKRPLGHGPGTAGPVSVHTDKPFITENYYLQLGYEVGVIGLILFLAVCVIVFLLLFRLPAWQAKVLAASFIGYAVCNLFLHTWANEAVATQWWLLAGVVIGSASVDRR
jgi:hypothetical protein